MKYVSENDWQTVLSSASRKAAIGAASVAGLGLLAGIILWDADFYAVRGRWENFKDAMFGPWRVLGKDQKRSFEDAFRDIVDFNFFQRVPIEGTTLAVITGTSFPSSSDVLAGRADSRWCYINVGSGNVGTRIELGRQAGDAAPVFLPLHTLSTAVLAETSLDVPRLLAIARTHCRIVPNGGRFSSPPASRRPT